MSLPGDSGDASFAIVAPYLPAPANTGGRIRIHELALALARRGPVDLFARVFPVEFAPDAGDVRPALAPYRARHTRAWGAGVGLPRLAARRVREACPRALRAALERAHARAPYAAVVVCHSYAFATAARLHGTALVLDEHNVESAYARAVAPAPDAPGARREVALLRRAERAAWARAHLVTAVTEADADAIRAHRAGPVALVPNGVAVRAIPFAPPSSRASRDVLFVGAMSHPPNVRAAVALATEVLPRLRALAPGATLTLCGRAPAPEVRALAGAHVTVTGTVPSVLPHLAAAGAYVVPLRDGAGSSLKVPEALAAGLPLVSTAVGVRGFPLAPGRDYLPAETPDAMARAVAAAWSDPAAADARAARGRAAALAYDWDPLGERFANLVLDAVAARPARRGPA